MKCIIHTEKTYISKCKIMKQVPGKARECISEYLDPGTSAVAQ